MQNCKECKREHEEIAFCKKCGKCLYKHSKQVIEKETNENEYYNGCFFKCECGILNFWD